MYTYNKINLSKRDMMDKSLVVGESDLGGERSHWTHSFLSQMIVNDASDHDP